MFRRMFALSEQGDKDLKKGILASAIANLSLMFPVGLLMKLLKDFLDPIITGNHSSINYLWYIGMIIVLVVVMYITHSIQYKLTYVSTYEESANRRVSLAEKIRKLPLSFFGEKDLSQLTSSMMRDCTEIEKTFSNAIPQLFGSIISIIFVVVSLFAFDWRMALAVFVVFPIGLLIIVGSKKIQDKTGIEKIDSQLKVSDGIQEFFENIQNIKAYSMEEEYLDGLDKKMSNLIKTSMRSELTAGTMVASSQMVLRLGFVSVILTGAYLMKYNSLDFMTYLFFIIISAKIYDPLSAIMMQIGEIFNSQLQINRMKEIENEKAQTGKENYTCKGYDIEFENVEFSYNGKRDKVLDDVSFVAKQGEVTALIGPSGSGKSTIAKLAARFWDVDKGRIKLGGVDVTSVEPERLLKSFSIVFQDVVLFNDTIMENIRLGRKNATDEEVIEAAKAARCDIFIEKMKDGYQTVIGENGSTLSGGERQRISIARALLKDSPVVLLDEATASLDVENETQVQEALGRLMKNKTVLVIAHKMRTIAGADKIVALDEGKVVQIGDPAELIKKPGLYRKMIELQGKSINWALER